MKTPEENFARNIKALRDSLDLTQGQVAEGVGVEMVTYQNYEALRRRPKKEIVLKIAKFFDVDPADLYKASHNEPKTNLESANTSKLISMLSKKMSHIPDDIVEMAQKFSLDHDIWEAIRGVFDAEIELLEEERNSENKKQA